MSEIPPSPIQAPPAHTAVKGLTAVVGFLVLVEFASGILQGYYTPIYPQIAEHLSISEGDINWFEAAQLIVSALCIPLLARLGDLIGHKQVLLISTAVTALGSWWLAFSPTFTTFLIGLGTPGCLRRVAAAGDRDHPPPHPPQRAAGAAHPARGWRSWSASSSSRSSSARSPVDCWSRRWT